MLLIKVLADLEKLRAAFFYRHLGPKGPEEGMPLQPESCAEPKPLSSRSFCSSWPSCFRQPHADPRRMRRSVRTFMSIARRTEKDPKVRKDLNILCAVPVLLIKVLADLKNLRVVFFYRHLGPSGPEEGMPLQPESRAAPKSLLSCSSCSSWPSCFRRERD